MLTWTKTDINTPSFSYAFDNLANISSVSLSKWSIPPDRFDDCYVQFLTSEMMLRLLAVSTVLILGEASAQPRWTLCAYHEDNVAMFMIAHCLVQILENIKWNSVRYCWWELLRTEIILSGSKPSGNLGRATCTRTTSRTTRGTSTSVSFTIIQHRNTSDELPGDINSGGAGFVGGPNVVTVMGADFCVEGEDIFWYYYS